MDLVIDANVFVVALLAQRVLNSEERKQRPSAIRLVREFIDGQHVVHLPRLAPIEVCSASRRRTGHTAPASPLRRRFRMWEARGQVTLYDLNETETERAADLAVGLGLRSADSVYAAVAERNGLQFKTFDLDITTKYSGASQP